MRTIAPLVLAGLALAWAGKVSGTGEEAPPGDGSGRQPVVPPVVPPDPLPIDTRPSSPPARDNVFTEIAGAGHDAWPAVYDGSFGQDVYVWLVEDPGP